MKISSLNRIRRLRAFFARLREMEGAGGRKSIYAKQRRSEMVEKLKFGLSSPKFKNKIFGAGVRGLKYTERISPQKSLRLADKKSVAKRLGLKMRQLKDVGIQSYRPFSDKFMILYNVMKSGHEKYGSTVAGRSHRY